MRKKIRRTWVWAAATIILVVALAVPVLFPNMNPVFLILGLLFWWGVVFLAVCVLRKP
jgi:hypothetical protein